jgi:hypothetical protein
MVDGRTAESCVSYNMIKMARMLFELNPESRYADFVERADLNAILGGQDPEDGRVSYMVPVGRGVQHEYQTQFDSFTCCVGSQMEAHAFHAYGIYDESGDKLWVTQYAPTTVDWASQGLKFEMITDMPMGESAMFKVTAGKKKATLAFRRPYWVGPGFSVKVNGKAVKNVSKPDSFIEVSRKWKPGDTVELILPKTLREEPLPDNANRMAIMWGPLVLAGDLGPEVLRQRGRRGAGGSAPNAAPELVPAKLEVTSWLKPVAGEDGVFRTANVGLKEDIEFHPFYEMPRRRYAIYWDVFTPTEWAVKSAAYEADADAEKKLTAATIGFAQPGQMQAERDFAEKDENSSPVQLQGRYGRQGNGWFSYELPVDPTAAAVLVVTYSNDARRPGGFDVLVDGTKVGEQTIERRSPEVDVKFFDVKYPLPLDMVKGKQKVTVRFQAEEGDSIPGVFGIRTVHADAAQ